MKKQLRFIINPVSGGGKNMRLVPVIDKNIDKNIYDVEIMFTQYAGHAIALSQEAALRNYFAVVAVGGDGSVNEVGKGLIGSNTALGIIPRGSGNGLAHHMGIPVLVPNAIKKINEGKIVKIDSLSINDHVCMGIAGIGFDAHVAHEFAKQGTRGLGTYCKVIFNEYGKFNPISFKFSVDGEEYEREAFLITFANSSQYGNMARIAPYADIQDGFMEVCVLKKIPLLKTFGFAFRLFTRSSHKSAFLEIIKTREITIHNYEQRVMHIDGEPLLIEPTINIKINPLSINIIS